MVQRPSIHCKRGRPHRYLATIIQVDNAACINMHACILILLYLQLSHACRSESPSQVFYILIQWLLLLHEKNELDEDIILAYDNMCNLERMRASRLPLPLEPPLDQLWIKVIKIIDTFHLPNHVSEECKLKYSPERIKEKYPHFNTQVGEQTFTWLHRFRHILCAMPKIHHLFYLHRMVVRRNLYTAKCYQHGKKPLLPKLTHDEQSQ